MKRGSTSHGRNVHADKGQNTAQERISSSNSSRRYNDRPQWNTNEELNQPYLWQQAMSRVSWECILPSELGGAENQTYHAWRGDKYLSAAAAEALHSNNISGMWHTKGSATKLTSIALSNSFLAAHKEIILPYLPANAVESLSERSLATILEAAVAQVYDVNYDAVLDLARWLIEKAEMTPDPNAKGKLLGYGGTVTVLGKEGTDHAPMYTAVAMFRGVTIEGKGSTKKKAEQLASERMLRRFHL